MKFKVLFIIILGLVATSIQAQDEPLPAENISVVKAYEPVLAEAEKINYNPVKPTEQAEQENSFSDYYMPNRFLKLSFEPPTVKPLAMKREKREYLERYWIKAGFGNMTTPLIDISGNSNADNALIIGANAKHIQSKGQLDLQEWASSEGSVFGEWNSTEFKINGGLKYERQAYNHYDTVLVNLELLEINADTFSRVNNTVTANIGMRNNRLNDFKDFEYNASVSPYYFFTQNEDREVGFHAQAGFYKEFDSALKPGAEINYYYDNYNHELIDKSVANTLINLVPKVKFTRPIFNVAVGADIIVASETSLQVSPDIYLEFYPIEKHLSVFASWNKLGENVNFHGLVKANPWTQHARMIDRDFSSYQQIFDTVIESRVVGFKGNYGRKWHGSIQAGQFISNNQPLFVPTFYQEYMFRALFEDEMDRKSIKANLTYKPTSDSDIGLEGAIHKYETTEYAQAWYLPESELRFYGAYTFIEKLRVNADFNLYNNLPYLDASDQLSEGVIKTQYDLNLSANYAILKNLDVFVDLLNVTNNKYDRYLYSPVFGTRAIGGIIARF